MKKPVSTYRLQLHRDFPLNEAGKLIPYLKQLGISHVYLSPLLKARSGSTHGYDLTNHGILNPEIASEEDFNTFCKALHENGMGLLLDFVPNHMGVDPGENPWWRDVLENGPSSPFAHYFDIDWNPFKPELRNKVLLPVLADQYGQVLERGEIQLVFDQSSLWIECGPMRFPVDPRQTPRVYRSGLPQLEAELGNTHGSFLEFQSILTSLENLPDSFETSSDRVAQRQREKEIARQRLETLIQADPAIARHIARAVAGFNGDPKNPSSFDALHALLEKQSYRLAYWKTALHEINYRRFFDVNELAGLRMEEAAVFESTHRLLLQWVQEGKVDGLRLDHPDGLYDPLGYLEQLQSAIAALPAGEKPRDTPFYIVLEKILSLRTETLPLDWPVAGTTGYDFLNRVNQVLLHGDGMPTLLTIYRDQTGEHEPFGDILYDSKKLIMSTSMSSELTVLSYELNRLSEANRRWRDFTLQSLNDALQEVVACFPVYRTYIRENAVSAVDEQLVTLAIRRAVRRNPAMEPTIFDFIRHMLLGTDPSLPASYRPRQRAFAMRFQQYTSPVQAKGMEDTAFYRYNALLSLNEVGGHPASGPISTEHFHREQIERHARWSGSLSATATHDTKRGEDARMRIHILPEQAGAWRFAVERWQRMNAKYKTDLEGQPAPDMNDEYLFYQALVGSWPTDEGRIESDVWTERMKTFMRKALKESKRHTSWIAPFEAYENAMDAFVERTLGDKTGFVLDFKKFLRPLGRPAAVHSLTQLTMKLTCPGTPDFYQGTEGWDFNLVDPDNRRPVDFARRMEWLTRVEDILKNRTEKGLEERQQFLRSEEAWQTGLIKLFVARTLLQLRNEAHPLFSNGRYVPIATRGSRASHVIAYARAAAGTSILVVVPRGTSLLMDPQDPWPPEEAWDNTTIELPRELESRWWSHVLTQRSIPVERGDTRLPLSTILADFPIAVLASTPNGRPAPGFFDTIWSKLFSTQK